VIVCTGRPVRRLDNRPTGRRCGATYPGTAESARAAGWRIGPARPGGDQPAMCPTCAAPGGTDEPAGQADCLEPLPGL
jgi:hypothetical protein